MNVPIPMIEPLLVRQERTILDELRELEAETRGAIEQSHSYVRAARASAERDYRDSRQEITGRFESEAAECERQLADARRSITTRFEHDGESAERELRESLERIGLEFENDEHVIKATYEDAKLETDAVFDMTRVGPKQSFREFHERLLAALHQLQAVRLEADNWIAVSRLPLGPADMDAIEALPENTPRRTMADCLSAAAAQWSDLSRMQLPRLFGVAAARNRMRSLYVALRQTITEGDAAARREHEQGFVRYRQQMNDVRRRRRRDARHAEKAYRRRTTEITQRREAGQQQAQAAYSRRMGEITHRHDLDLRLATDRHARASNESQRLHDEGRRQADELHRQQLEECQTRHAAQMHSATDLWQQGIARFQKLMREIQRESSRAFPDWSAIASTDWVAPPYVPSVVRFGELEVPLADAPSPSPGTPEEGRGEGDAGLVERLAGDPHPNPLPKGEGTRGAAAPQEPSLHLPALLQIPNRGSMLLKANGDGRAAAVTALQGVILRLLTAIPPGKAKFTIIDPVGLGQNFAAVMHLADYDEALVNSRIWTEPAQIEQRLADLTEQMETIIQKYLRNEFQTIAQYNAQAGEVAEPLRFVVVANFPAGFTEAAARRLVSIMDSGPRCGVHVLLSLDAGQRMPHAFNAADLERHCVTLDWQQGQFVWTGSEFEPYRLTIDAPPAAELFTTLVKLAGERASRASRVEVPFERIAPPIAQWWTGDSSSGLSVPLGPAGATKNQHLQLGKGTAQHVLIAGKTGSGKSTLLHALITNASLLYSPEEVELYLVDFKKGVEFKTYATHQLPHARVVAIESDREFGLSVLQRLDAELKNRGDRFRALGVQDLNAYRREAAKADRLPRILLVVDEFQELFVEDDRITQDVALLLDRLVRQGRAFGIHVLLGSQTLGGAYSLARSTIGQMAVRIALQCSEADAHLVLSEDNTAARLLSRPGEAIYNDAGGLIEANHPFQVAWLPDDRREDYLRRIHELAEKHDGLSLEPQIVFEGNVPADVANNRLLHRLLAASDWPTVRSPAGWLGEAVAIKDPTSAVFQPQSGSNLLIVGQNQEAALAMMSTALVSLAAQRRPAADPAAGSRFVVLDGSPADSPLAGFLRRVAGSMPHCVRTGGWRDTPPLINEVAVEVDRRLASPDSESPPLYLLIFDLQRFRDLRRQEDDFGFSRTGEGERPSPAKQLATILRDGPAVNVHALVWCDTPSNLGRTFDRQTLRDFELRVLFQMSAGDSSNLIDSPAASKLGLHRAYFYSEEQDRLEKFRPYGLPSADWLEWAERRLKMERPTTRQLAGAE